MLANAAYLAYPVPGAAVSIAADASDIAVAAVLQQQLPDGTIQPLAFFSRSLDPTQMRWSIFGRELLAVYLGIKHFVHYLEGTNFMIYTDHSALISTAATGMLRDIPREVRHLQYIASFRPGWKHLPGAENITADAPSRSLTCIQKSKTIKKEPITAVYHTNESADTITDRLQHAQHNNVREHQATDQQLQQMLVKQTAKPTEPVTLKKIGDIYCQISPNMQPRAYIPKPLRDTMLHILHDVAHPGVRATLRLVQDRYF